MPYRVSKPNLLVYTEEEHWRFQNKKEGTDQEMIQSSNTPDPKYYKRSRAYFLSLRGLFFSTIALKFDHNATANILVRYDAKMLTW